MGLSGLLYGDLYLYLYYQQRHLNIPMVFLLFNQKMSQVQLQCGDGGSTHRSLTFSTTLCNAAGWTRCLLAKANQQELFRVYCILTTQRTLIVPTVDK
jgi:hypothetical protein